jgi:ABC-type oligopeptide transport system substrate-binding subunit
VPELLPGLKSRAPTNDSAARERLAAAVKAGDLGLALHTYFKPAHKILAEWAQGQWEKHLGIRIPIEVQESKVYWKEVITNPAPIFFGGVTAPFGHPRAFMMEFLTTSTANWTSWRSAEYDKAVAGERFALAESILEKEGWVIPIYQRDTVALVRSGWKGFHINPLGQVFLSEVR